MKNQMFSKFLSASLIVLLALAALPVTPVRAANYFTRANGNWNANVTWSTAGCGGAAVGAGVFPVAGDTVTICSGHNVTVNVNSAAASVTFNAAAANNGITISGTNTLTVTGAINMTNVPTANNVTTTLAVGTGTLNAGSISIAGSPTNNRDTILSVSSGTINTTGDITFSGTAGQAQLNVTNNAATLTVGGNFTGGGTFDLANPTNMSLGGNYGFTGTLSNNNRLNLTLNGAGAQSLTGTLTLLSLIVNKPGGTATLGANVVTRGNLTVSSGILDLSTFSADRNANGGILTVSNGATLRIGGTNTMPTNYATHTFGATSTVEYYGTAQTVSVDTYGNLILSGSGLKTISTGTSVTGTMNIIPMAVASITGGATVIPVNALSLNSVGQVNGTWGSTTSTATNQNNTYFNNGINPSGILNVATNTSPNTPPSGTDNTITINEDSSHTFAAGDFGFTDPDAGDTMSAVRIDTLSLPVGATLQLSSVDVTAGQVILTASIPNLVFTPAANANGVGYASFTFSVRDTFGPAFDTTPNTMTFNVTAVNDQPSFTASNPPAVNEDAGAQTVVGWVTAFNPGPPNESGQAVSQYIISNSTCGTLLSAGPSVNTAGTLTYTPAADQNGTCTFDVQVQDNGGTANGGVDTSPTQNFTITVNAVNDAPSFTASNPPAVNEDAGAQTLVGWVTAFNPGPANEAGQAVLQYIISNSTCGTLLSAGPSVNTAGTLTYTPAADQNGTCTFDVQVQDNGGTANGGVDTSAAQNFTITVNAVDDPSIANDDVATVWEDSSANTIDVRLNDTDIDSGVELIQSVTQPANGTVVITNAGADLTYQPNADYCNDGTPTDDFTYTLVGGNSATVQVTVTCQTVITANITASNKTYDGNTSASFTCSLTGVIPPDVVTCTGGTATFADKNVGTGKLVTATGLGLGGADAYKYELASTSATDTADITERTLNVTASGVNKVYDGNTDATVTLSDDRVGGDDLTVTYTSASFADPNVGNGILVSVSGISISGGADAGNYVLGNTTASTTADITPANQTITVTQNAPSSAANGSSFDVAATASSGLPVTITTSGSCSGGDTDGDATITMTSGTGICSVFYNQAGNSNYNAAPQVQEDVNATESPVFTSADNVTFDVGFAGSFTVTATGNPSAMTISMTGALPSGVTFTDNGDGTAALAGTPAVGSNGVYNLIFTADNGVAPNGIQNFTLTVKTGPVIGANGVGSNPDTGDGSITENEVIVSTLGITQLTVEFSQDVYDPADDTDPNDVTNPANYLLVRGSASGTFSTVSCEGGVVAPDVAIAVDSVTYSNGGGSGPFIATLNINGGFPLNVAGFYRLFVCGTTSIVDADNTDLILAGDGTTPGTDFVRNFRLQDPVVGGGGGGGEGGRRGTTAAAVIPSGLLIPVTGFAPGTVTALPAQPAENAYAASGLKLEIPSLSLNLPIVGVSLKEGGWDVTWLGGNAGYLEGSAYPTWKGNTVLTGHVTDANGKPGPFAYLKELTQGDKVYIYNNGFVYVYQVQQNGLLAPNNVKALFKSEEYDWLTLVTCEDYDPSAGQFKYRRMVRATLISVIPAK